MQGWGVMGKGVCEVRELVRLYLVFDIYIKINIIVLLKMIYILKLVL